MVLCVEILGDNPARFVGQLYIFLEMRDGDKGVKECEAADRVGFEFAA